VEEHTGDFHMVMTAESDPGSQEIQIGEIEQNIGCKRQHVQPVCVGVGKAFEGAVRVSVHTRFSEQSWYRVVRSAIENNEAVRVHFASVREERIVPVYELGPTGGVADKLHSGARLVKRVNKNAVGAGIPVSLNNVALPLEPGRLPVVKLRSKIGHKLKPPTLSSISAW
jgi:hypothetical protein